jgi:acyl-CoA thioesterase I
MRLGLCSAGFVLLVAGCGQGEDVPAPVSLPPVIIELPKINNNYVQCGSFSSQPMKDLPWRLSAPSDWVVLGSSSAFGAGASSVERSWVKLLQNDKVAAAANVHNIARGGYTTYQALSAACTVSPERRQPDPVHNIDQALALSADLVLLSFPSNDAALAYGAEETAANILLLRQQLADKNTALLVLSAQPRNMALEKQRLLLALNSILRPVLTDCFVDVYAALADSNGGLSAKFDAGDGVHLNDAGHQLVFEAVRAALQAGKCVILP